MDGVESDLRNMGIKRWRKRASDRTERAYVVRENQGKLNAVVLKKNIKNDKSYDRDANSLPPQSSRDDRQRAFLFIG
jgi:hypothetical protein